MANPLFTAVRRLRDGLNIGVSGSRSISPTAYYTGYVWARHDIGPSKLATAEGRILFWSMQPAMTALSLAGVPNLEQVLLARHAVLDALLTDAIESGQVGNVIELASGMSPRGLSFADRFGDQITYVETDLPRMAALKKAELEGIGETSGHHRVVVLDALADEGDTSLAAVCAGLDHSKGLAVISEGLLNYLPREAVEGLWGRIAQASRDFPHGVYLSDLHVAEDHNGHLERLSIAGLSAFVRGQVHLHFTDTADVERALAKAGFDQHRVPRPAEFADRIPSTQTRGAKYVRIIDAHTEPA